MAKQAKNPAAVEQVGDHVDPPKPNKAPEPQLPQQQAPATAVDGFEGYNAAVEGQEDRGPRVIQGTKWSFTNEGVWADPDDLVVPPTREVVVVDVARVVQKWIAQMPVETRFVPPGEPMPDIKALNDAAPKSEWTEDLNGKARGPWQSSHIAYMVDLATMERFTYPTSTIGGSVCIDDVVTATKLMRRLRPGACPVVRPKSTFMNTRFGGRQRPFLEIVRWIKLDGSADVGGQAALPAPTPPTPQGVKEVTPPTVREELDDDIPF